MTASCPVRDRRTTRRSHSWVVVIKKRLTRECGPAPAQRLANSDALLPRTDLRELGLERRAVDAVFRALPVVVLPGYSRPLVRVADYVELLERSTYDRDRVRLTGRGHVGNGH